VPLSEEIIAQFTQRLLPGEQLQWTGSPSLEGGLDKVDRVLIAGLAAILLGFVVLLGLTLRFPLNFYDFVLFLGLAACLYSFIAPARNRNKKFRQLSAYAVTDQRVMMLVQTAAPQFYAQEIGQLASASLISWSAHAPSLFFGMRPEQAGFWPRILWWGFDLEKLCVKASRLAGVSFPPFLDLPEADQVQEYLLAKIREQDLQVFFSRGQTSKAE
jgi:hypothetical protein